MQSTNQTINQLLNRLSEEVIPENQSGIMIGNKRNAGEELGSEQKEQKSMVKENQEKSIIRLHRKEEKKEGKQRRKR
jgi:hypothetical protein